jgi:predicted extracellular nuclease
MSISAAAASTALSTLKLSDTPPPKSTPASTTAAAPVHRPSVINSVGGISSISGQIASSPSIQSSVSGINAQIADFNGTVWSRTGLTPQQIANGKLQFQKVVLAAEGATIAFAGQEGVTGISFDFGTVSLGVSPSASATEKTSASGDSPPTAAASSALKANSANATSSAADIALSLLSQSPKPLNVLA